METEILNEQESKVGAYVACGCAFLIFIALTFGAFVAFIFNDIVMAD
jgi:uncharacterized membrane protein SpoIIM required for sporulation